MGVVEGDGGLAMDAMAVLVVDDEEAVRTGLAEFLKEAGYQVRTAQTGAQALEMLAGGSFDAVLLDVVMPDMSGLEVLERYRAGGGGAPVVVLSALAGADDAVRAMKLGATDYLCKPFDTAELESSLSRVLGRSPSMPLRPAPKPELSTLFTPPVVSRPQDTPILEELVEDRTERQLVSISGAMRRARALVERIADADVPVLLLGESGVGKEVIAREIHERSRRRNRPFIKVNCAALPAELLESELFGHERGAFTGATAEKPGKFELADQGTIFLDEIGEMAIRLQAKLLQVLQDEEFFRVGGKKSVRVDSRVVVATNRELEREIELGNFREDLYYRLNVVAIRVAPLRERREDILPLVEYFLQKYGRRYKSTVAELPAEVVKAFMEYDWPGNVRELENMVRRMVVLKDPLIVLDEVRGRSSLGLDVRRPSLPTAYGGEPYGGSVSSKEPHIPVNVVDVPVNDVPRVPSAVQYANPFDMPQPPPPPLTVPENELSLKDIGKRAAMLAEREAILAMLQRTAWNKRKAASKLKISYKALLYKIKESGIIDPRSTAEP
jgi:two-component system, NtrC family, response regulator AtoC